MSTPLKYTEDLLARWDRRVQIEATLLFFFTCTTASSFLSIAMFWKADHPILDVIPFMYLVCMLCWWHVSKRLAFNTTENNSSMMWSNAFAFWIWQVITASVSFSTWDEWGWNKDADGEKHPVVDNLFRLVNCMLPSAFIVMLNVDYYLDLSDRLFRIKVWCTCLAVHSLIALAYFADWISIHREETLAAQWLATIGAAAILIASIFVLLTKPDTVSIDGGGVSGQSLASCFTPPKIPKSSIIFLVIGVVFYWWGSAALNCDFYPETSDMTMMPGYQMLWIIVVLILFEVLPSFASEISVFGAQLLADEEQWEDHELDGTDMYGDEVAM
jgi:hypothetical protein